MDGNTIGKWAFIIGIVLALVLAFVDLGTVGALVLLILAILGGWFHVTMDNRKAFLISALALAAFSGALGGLPAVGEYISNIMAGISAFVSAAALTVLVREVLGWVGLNM
jgi:O-antigen ligase